MWTRARRLTALMTSVLTLQLATAGAGAACACPPPGAASAPAMEAMAMLGSHHAVPAPAMPCHHGTSMPGCALMSACTAPALAAASVAVAHVARPAARPIVRRAAEVASISLPPELPPPRG